VFDTEEYGKVGAHKDISGVVNKMGGSNSLLMINVGDGRASITRFMLLLSLSRWLGMGRGWMGLTNRRPSLLMEHSRKEGAGRSWAVTTTLNFHGVKQKA
jgi:hypothetical protein